MTVKQFIEYLECLPVDEETLLGMDIKFRVPNSTGQYNQVVNPNKVDIEKILPNFKDIVIITTGMIK